MATLQQAMTIARYITNDTNATAYSRLDPELLQYGNDALDEIARVLPGLFHAVIEIACIANKTMQTLSVSDSLGLVDILNIKDGNTITPVERRTLDRFIPGWNIVTPAAAEHWMPIDGDPFRFEVYPPSPTGQVLIGIHVAKPLEYTATATHNLPDSFTPIIADYIVARLDSKEDEYAVNSRAKMFMESFFAKLAKSAPQN